MVRNINALVIHPKDSVAVAVDALQEGEIAVYHINGEERSLILATSVPIYHKFAVAIIRKGSDVYKYGETIGRASQDILIGEHVHTHNLVSVRENIRQGI